MVLYSNSSSKIIRNYGRFTLKLLDFYQLHIHTVAQVKAKAMKTDDEFDGKMKEKKQFLKHSGPGRLSCAFLDKN